jgi:type III secretory pathway component EscT
MRSINCYRHFFGFNVAMVDAIVVIVIVVFYIDVFSIIIAIISITINVTTLQIPSKKLHFTVLSKKLFYRGGAKKTGGDLNQTIKTKWPR